jgi:hypothetical protein
MKGIYCWVFLFIAFFLRKEMNHKCVSKGTRQFNYVNLPLFFMYFFSNFDWCLISRQLSLFLSVFPIKMFISSPLFVVFQNTDLPSNGFYTLAGCSTFTYDETSLRALLYRPV